MIRAFRSSQMETRPGGGMRRHEGMASLFFARAKGKRGVVNVAKVATLLALGTEHVTKW